MQFQGIAFQPKYLPAEVAAKKASLAVALQVEQRTSVAGSRRRNRAEDAVFVLVKPVISRCVEDVVLALVEGIDIYIGEVVGSDGEMDGLLSADGSGHQGNHKVGSQES